jgi:hypothetical protein
LTGEDTMVTPGSAHQATHKKRRIEEGESANIEEPATPASERVLGLPELFEWILSYLPPLDLIRLKGTCTRFWLHIDDSQACEKKLFLTPISPVERACVVAQDPDGSAKSNLACYVLNPFIAIPESSKDHPGELCHAKKFFIDHPLTMTPPTDSASYEMFITQPPITCIRIEIIGYKHDQVPQDPDIVTMEYSNGSLFPAPDRTGQYGVVHCFKVSDANCVTVGRLAGMVRKALEYCTLCGSPGLDYPDPHGFPREFGVRCEILDEQKDDYAVLTPKEHEMIKGQSGEFRVWLL